MAFAFRERGGSISGRKKIFITNTLTSGPLKNLKAF
jgi:hypothetical protein